MRETLGCGCAPPWLAEPQGVSPKPGFSWALRIPRGAQGVWACREALAGLSYRLLGCCPSLARSGISRPSLRTGTHPLVSPALPPLPFSWGWPCLGTGLCSLLGFLLLRDLLAFTTHLPTELLTCLLAGIMAFLWPSHRPSSSGSGNGKSH